MVKPKPELRTFYLLQFTDLLLWLMLYLLSCCQEPQANFRTTLGWEPKRKLHLHQSAEVNITKHNWNKTEQKLNPGPEEVLALLQSTLWSHLYFPPEIRVLESKLQEQIQISGWKFNNNFLNFQSELHSVTTLSESLLRHQRYSAPVCVCFK